MTPADHYAEAEHLIEAIVEACAPGEIDVQAQASIIAMGILGNIHATLATVPALRPETVVACTCRSLTVEPLARVHTDTDCPIHGGP